MPANCQTANTIRVCTACNNRYYLDSNNLCQPVNSLCNTYNNTNGLCLTCTSNYIVNSIGLCVSITSDVNCLQTDTNNNCIKCATNYFISNGNCIASNPLCTAYDPTTRLCTACISNYYLGADSQCISEIKMAQIDPNCQVADNNNYCIQCQSGYFTSAGNC